VNTISADLSRLHDRYVESVNLAIAGDDVARAEELAAEFDLEALDVIRRGLAA